MNLNTSMLNHTTPQSQRKRKEYGETDLISFNQNFGSETSFAVDHTSMTLNSTHPSIQNGRVQSWDERKLDDQRVLEEPERWEGVP